MDINKVINNLEKEKKKAELRELKRKKKRLELGYTLNKFAVECEIDSAILSRIENLKNRKN